MTDRSNDLVDTVAEAIWKAYFADTGSVLPVPAYKLAQAAIDAMQLTPQIRETWPSEESGMSGPVRETCWQTPWEVGR